MGFLPSHKDSLIFKNKANILFFGKISSLLIEGQTT